MNIEEFREYCLSLGKVTENIQLNFGGDVSDSEILELVKQSYEIVKDKYTK